MFRLVNILAFAAMIETVCYEPRINMFVYMCVVYAFHSLNSQIFHCQSYEFARATASTNAQKLFKLKIYIITNLSEQ